MTPARGMVNDTDPSAEDIARLIQQIRTTKVKAIFIENMNDPRLIERVAREAGARLLMLEQNGFLLRKVETYDSRYRGADAYEWAMPTGGHGLSFTNPRLLLTCRPITGTVAVTMPTRLDRKALLTADGSRPTAVMFTPQEIVERATRALAPDLQGRADWQRARIGELHKVGGDQVSNWSNVAGDEGYKAAYTATLETIESFWSRMQVELLDRQR